MARQNSSFSSVSCRRSHSGRRPGSKTTTRTSVTRILVVAMAILSISSVGRQSPRSFVEALSVPGLTTPPLPGVSSHHYHSAGDRRSPWRRSTTTRLIPADHRNKNIDNDGFVLFLAQQTPQPRMPRRMLKKRIPKEGDRRGRKRHRRNRHAEVSVSTPIGTIVPGVISKNNKKNPGRIASALEAATQELRPLVPSVRRDLGEDYWIDPEDLERERLRKEEQERQRIAFENRSGDNEAMPQEKLMTEVKAPYRQNWIGYFSLMVAVLSIIVSQFPELLEPAAITRFPDL